MKLDEIFITDDDIDEWKATRELCKSSRSNASLGASALASCKSQGLRARDTKVKHTINKKRQNITGRKVRGKKYGGPLPFYGSGTST
jgi:hypothetical protein|tara:strand:- start:2084 stop:2344 length:261 start_codon:yes stop_codon:yes gene_type:complete